MRWIFHECLYRTDEEPRVDFDLLWAYHWGDHIEYRGYSVRLSRADNFFKDITYYKSRHTTMAENAEPWFKEAKEHGRRSDFYPLGGWGWGVMSDKAYARWPEGVRTRIEEMIPLMRIML